MMNIKLNEEQETRFKRLREEYNELHKRYLDTIEDVKKELNIPEKYPILGFLYYNEYEGSFGDTRKVEKCRLVYLVRYNFGHALTQDRSCLSFTPVFKSVSKDGSPGNYFQLLHSKEAEFEPFVGTVEEARKILKESKKIPTSKKQSEMKFHKYPQEEPEGNVSNKNNFLCKVLYSIKNEKEGKTIHERELYNIGYWQDGHWDSHNVYQKRDDDGLLHECKVIGWIEIESEIDEDSSSFCGF